MPVKPVHVPCRCSVSIVLSVCLLLKIMEINGGAIMLRSPPVLVFNFYPFPTFILSFNTHSGIKSHSGMGGKQTDREGRPELTQQASNDT